MLKNHFARIKSNKTISTPILSIILNAIPKDKLMTKDDMALVVLADKNVQSNRVNNTKAAIIFIEELTKNGFLKEFSGVWLESRLSL